VAEYPNREGFADYAFFVQGKLLGILEAKKVGVGAQNVLEQAKRAVKDLRAIVELVEKEEGVG
jgi:type I restriction enzyme R subunit